jgi:hypothetical protein
LQSEAADQLAIIGVDFGDDVGAISLEGAYLGEIAFVNEEETGGGAERNGTEEKECERDSVNQFPAAEAQSYWGQTQHERKILAQIEQRHPIEQIRSFHRENQSVE